MFLSGLTRRSCCSCDALLVDGETYFILYPYDLYCVACAKKHPDYGR